MDLNCTAIVVSVLVHDDGVSWVDTAKMERINAIEPHMRDFNIDLICNASNRDTAVMNRIEVIASVAVQQ